MNSASKYWTRVTLDAAGNCNFEEIRQAQIFFWESFSEFTTQNEVPDALIQRHLLAWRRGERASSNPEKANLAESCLQCFISHHIEKACQRLVSQFGVERGFKKSDLLPFVLDDNSRRNHLSRTNKASTYRSLQRDILESFDPNQSSLATWTSKRVKHHRELNAFLLEHGIYLVSDWAILNDTNTKQLQRIFSQFYQRTEIETRQAMQILESYHAVYRVQRLKQRQAGNKGRCLIPTIEQLQQIAQRLVTSNNSRLTPEVLMAQLQEIAALLREYRIKIRGRTLPTESINDPNFQTKEIVDFIDTRDEADEQAEFLQFYRQQFLDCLDRALRQVIQDKFTINSPI